MPNTSKPPKKKGSAVRETFENYKRKISEHVIETHGSSYQTYDDVKDTWVTTFKYTPDIEKDIINTSKFFVRLMDSRDSKSTDPIFLYSLFDLIAEFLAEYTVRKAHGMIKKLEHARLLKILWDENTYIRGLLARQARKRNSHYSKARKLREEKNKRIEKAIEEKRVAQQVKYEFVSVAFYRKK